MFTLYLHRRQCIYAEDNILTQEARRQQYIYAGGDVFFCWRIYIAQETIFPMKQYTVYTGVPEHAIYPIPTFL